MSDPIPKVRQYELDEFVALRSRCPHAVDGLCDCHPAEAWEIERRVPADDVERGRARYEIRNIMTGARRVALDVDLLPFAELNTEACDDEAICWAILAKTDDLMMPILCGSEEIDGVTVTIVECVLPDADPQKLPRRGFLWHAIVGDFELRPARYDEYETPVPGIGQGGELLATSTVSARQALANARANLRRRAGAS